MVIKDRHDQIKLESTTGRRHDNTTTKNKQATREKMLSKKLDHKVSKQVEYKEIKLR